MKIILKTKNWIITWYLNIFFAKYYETIYNDNFKFIL